MARRFPSSLRCPRNAYGRLTVFRIGRQTGPKQVSTGGRWNGGYRQNGEGSRRWEKPAANPFETFSVMIRDWREQDQQLRQQRGEAMVGLGFRRAYHHQSQRHRQ